MLVQRFACAAALRLLAICLALWAGASSAQLPTSIGTGNSCDPSKASCLPGTAPIPGSSHCGPGNGGAPCGGNGPASMGNGSSINLGAGKTVV